MLVPFVTLPPTTQAASSAASPVASVVFVAFVPLPDSINIAGPLVFVVFLTAEVFESVANFQCQCIRDRQI